MEVGIGKQINLSYPIHLSYPLGFEPGITIKHNVRERRFYPPLAGIVPATDINLIQPDTLKVLGGQSSDYPISIHARCCLTPVNVR